MKVMKYPLAHVLVLLSLFLSAQACWAGAANTQGSADAGSATPLPTKLLPSEQNTVNIVKRYKHSVVAVNVTVQGKRVNPLKGMPPQVRQFFKQFENPQMQHQGQTERAAGSGFVVDSDGQILTNYHVVADALKKNSTDLKDSASIKVQFSGGTELPVKVVSADESYDLALLQLKNPKQLPENATPIPLANSDKVQVGEKAIAIGNPFALQSTVTQGVVSAVNREQAALVSGIPIEYIQTDASINPGNSGGPLIDSRGQVIGINDEILAPSGGSIGVGFAIPSNLVRNNLAQLKSGGYIKKPMIGVEIVPVNKYPAALKQQLHLPDHGVMIVAVEPHSPAAKAGLKGAQFTVDTDEGQFPAGGDIILRANGKKISSGTDLQNLVFSQSAGSKIKLLVLHNDEKKTVTVTLTAPKTKSQK